MTAVKTHRVEICMAGDVEVAKQVCREFCYGTGFCVTVTPTTYIYTAGEESGFLVRAINYPRFPAEPHEIKTKAWALAELLAAKCCQQSFSIVSDDITTWHSLTPPALKPRSA